jgi:hypothetical protein
MAFIQFTANEQLLQVITTDTTIDLSAYAVPNGFDLISQSCYLTNARLTAYIDSIPVTNELDTSSLDTNQIQPALYQYLYNSPRKQVNLSLASTTGNIRLGEIQLINNGFPYSFYNLDETINGQLNLTNFTGLLIESEDVGYGKLNNSDKLILQGQITREVVLYKVEQPIVNLTESPVITIPTPNINLTISGSITPTPPPTPIASTIEDIMKILRANAWYKNFESYVWTWTKFSNDYLSISPFIIDSGCQLSAIGFFVQMDIVNNKLDATTQATNNTTTKTN